MKYTFLYILLLAVATWAIPVKCYQFSSLGATGSDCRCAVFQDEIVTPDGTTYTRKPVAVCGNGSFIKYYVEYNNKDVAGYQYGRYDTMYTVTCDYMDNPGVYSCKNKTMRKEDFFTKSKNDMKENVKKAFGQADFDYLFGK